MSHNKQNNEQQQQQSHQQKSKIQNLNGRLKQAVPDAEVVVRAKRRQFSRAYKLDILEQVEHCIDAGQVGALLRGEGLYSSHLTRWRQARERGLLDNANPTKRGRKAEPQAVELARLKKENERLKKQLEQAELIIEVQKKVSQLVGLRLPQSNENE